MATSMSSSRKNAALLGNGRGGFSPAPHKTPAFVVEVGKRPYQRLRVADIDADGRADILTTNTDGNDVSVLLSDSQG